MYVSAGHGQLRVVGCWAGQFLPCPPITLSSACWTASGSYVFILCKPLALAYRPQRRP